MSDFTWDVDAVLSEFHFVYENWLWQGQEESQKETSDKHIVYSSLASVIMLSIEHDDACTSYIRHLNLVYFLLSGFNWVKRRKYELHYPWR